MQHKVFSSFKTEKDPSKNENIIIYLPGKNLRENNNLIKSKTEDYNSTAPVIFLLTGEDNSSLKINKRSKRDTKDLNEIQSFPDQIENTCVIVHISKASLTFNE